MKLPEIYADFNRRFWKGKLPRDVQVRWKRGLSVAAWYDGDRLITINSYLKGWECLVKMTLLHEMAHVSTRSECQEHGPRWQAEMRRLARDGAFAPFW